MKTKENKWKTIKQISQMQYVCFTKEEKKFVLSCYMKRYQVMERKRHHRQLNYRLFILDFIRLWLH